LFLQWHWYVSTDDGRDPSQLLFTENDTNFNRVWGTDNTTPYVKDAFHRHIINGEKGAVNPDQHGTKCCAVFQEQILPGKTFIVNVRFSERDNRSPFVDFETIMSDRRTECDDFYEHVHRKGSASILLFIFRNYAAKFVENLQ
jgi:hypothetical protein